MSNTPLDQLADHVGILAEWHDLSGTHIETTSETKRAILAAMGFSTDDAGMAEVVSELAQTNFTLPNEIIVNADTPTTINAPGRGDWHLTEENGTIHRGTTDTTATLPPLPTGYHQLTINNVEVLVLAAPPRSPSVRQNSSCDRLWGVTASLYALRSERNLGFGDYADLASLASILADNGADFVGINPIHAVGTSSDVISPYSPSHRLFLDTRHIALDRVLEFRTSVVAQRLLADRGPDIDALREATLVDYASHAILAAPIQNALFETFMELDERSDRRKAFTAFCETKGKPLRDFCLFEVLSQTHGPDWRKWPQDLQHPDAPAANAVAINNQRKLAYHAYLQWITEAQIEETQRTAKQSGMALGLYTDLAVGVRPDGAETWANPSIFAKGVSLGAPPDYFNTNGQIWGLAPFNPDALRQAGFWPFIKTIRAVARHAGMIRIDHILGLQRCYWLPEDTDVPGGYVRYPFDVLLAIVRIEAHRAQCLVIGEDLGVVPEGFRDQIQGQGILGCSVMQFERWDDAEFRHPRDYRPLSLASFGSHDTPTIGGYWHGRDIDERRQMGLIDEPTQGHQHHERYGDRYRLQRLTGLTDDVDSPSAADNVAAAIHDTLANGASVLSAVQLDDVMGQVDQPNMPGTIDEYPNWRIKNAGKIETLNSSLGLTQVSGIFGNRRGKSADTANKD